MGLAWYYVVNDDRVEIHVRSSSGTFLLQGLPRDWRAQFLNAEVQDAILAELSARQMLVWPNRRKTNDEPDGETVLLSWYSIRARLTPSTLDPVGPTSESRPALPFDGRYTPGCLMLQPDQTLPAGA